MRTTTALVGLLSIGALGALGCSAWIDTDPERAGDPFSPGQSPSCATGCDDGIACTVDACVLGVCVHTPGTDRCAEGELCNVSRGCVPSDGCVGAACPCLGDACDGGGPACSIEPIDADGDGHSAVVQGQPACGSDCNDDDPSVYPGARELCNGRDDDCDGVPDDGCVNVPPLCAMATPIVLNAGAAQLTGTLGQQGMRTVTACGAGTGRGAVYSLEVRELADIIIDTSGSSFPTLVAVGTDCAGEGGFNVACAGTRGRTPTSRLVIHRYDPSVQRTLFILVDSQAPRDTGDFKLSVQVQPAVSYSCFGAPLDISEGGTLVGFMAGSGSLSASCLLSGILFNEPEVVVRYTASGPTRLRCEAVSTAFSPVLYAQGLCGVGLSELGCTAATGNGAGRAELDLELGAGNEAFVVVDRGSQGGKYELTCEEQ